MAPKRIVKALRPTVYGWLTAAVLAGLPMAQTLSMGGIEEGRPFPNVLLPRLEDGRPASVSDFRGRKLALHIWASW